MTDFDDGWGSGHTDREFMDAYDIVEEMLTMPLERKFPEADLNEFRPKYKRHQQHHKKKETDDDETELACFDSDSDNGDFLGEQKAFFSPPLQVQRNNFVRDQLLDFRLQCNEISTVAVMGCGEMSLERHLIPYFAEYGTQTVLSADIDEKSISIGEQLLRNAIEQHEKLVSIQIGFPVLFRAFQGDILELDYRFANVDCIISLEVIEHMELNDAYAFVNRVLKDLCPRIFIVSTPNHDYNEAFGEENGVFRHDDHKFEMSAEQFAAWLVALQNENPDYLIGEPHYIGCDERYKHLNGATQAAVIRLRENSSSTVGDNVRAYKMVSQKSLPVGLMRLKHNLLRKAFIEWLEVTELREGDLKKSDFSEYWLINIRKIYHHMHANMTFVMKIEEVEAVRTIHSMCSNQVYVDFTNGVNSIVIPRNVNKIRLLEFLNSGANQP